MSGKRLVYTDSFDSPNLPGEMAVTVTLEAVSVGTEMSIEQQGVPDIIRASWARATALPADPAAWFFPLHGPLAFYRAMA